MRKNTRTTMLLMALIAVMLTSLACQFGVSTNGPTATTEADVTQPVTVTEAVATDEPVAVETVAAAEGAVTNLQDVQKATIQIEAQGTFNDPEVGLVLNSAGRGSGFIIDPSGLAVTNNHVVAGAALLKVYVGGDASRQYNAKVLGTSECSDLAVIDIEGDGFPYLQWYDGPITVGTDIFVAGFPLGDPEFTLTSGVISKAKADGMTSWSAVDSVIEYDATSNPGNSGGPVIDRNGRVMGVHYMGNRETRQAFGISKEVALAILDDVENGANVDRIGINPQTVSNEAGDLTGVWVSSVQSGSAADKAGLRGGDIIVMMENIVLVTDGTMRQYCEILRSHKPGDTLSLKVLRWDTQEILEGQLNGRELEVVGTRDTTTTDPVTTEEGTAAPTDGNPDASASGEVYLSTDFDNADAWYTITVPDTDNFDAETNNGRLFMDVKDKNSTVYAFHDLVLNNPDVLMEAAVETVGGPNENNISLVCRATDDGWYEFSMNSGGYWYIWKYADQKYTQLNNGGSYAINLQRAKNTITASCIGTTLTFYVNGVKMGSATDNRFKGGGQVGVSVSTFSYPGAQVEFDWFSAVVP